MTPDSAPLETIPYHASIGHMLLSNDPLRVTKTAHGWVLWHRHDSGVGRSLDQLGEYLATELQFLAQFIHPGDVVIDAGAYIGTHTLVFAQRVAPTGRVIAIEPNRAPFQMLCANLMMNGVVGIDTLHAAAGESPGSFNLPTFHEDRTFDRSMFNLKSVPNSSPGMETVPVLTIDSLNLPRCRMIKIDAPGSTFEVLNGARETLRQRRPLLHVSVYSHEDIFGLRRTLPRFGYDLYDHRSLLYRSGNAAGLATDPFNGQVLYNIFAAPKELDLQITDIPTMPPLEEKGKEGA